MLAAACDAAGSMHRTGCKPLQRRLRLTHAPACKARALHTASTSDTQQLHMCHTLAHALQQRTCALHKSTKPHRHPQNLTWDRFKPNTFKKPLPTNSTQLQPPRHKSLEYSHSWLHHRVKTAQSTSECITDCSALLSKAARCNLAKFSTPHADDAIISCTRQASKPRVQSSLAAQS